MASNFFTDFEFRHTKEVHDQLLAQAQARSRQVREGAELSLQLQWKKEEADRARERADALDRQIQNDRKKAEQEQRVRQLEINAEAEKQRQQTVQAEKQHQQRVQASAAQEGEPDLRRLRNESIAKAQQELQRQLNVQAQEAQRKQAAAIPVAQPNTIPAAPTIKSNSIHESTASITPSKTPVAKVQSAAPAAAPAASIPVVRFPEIVLAGDLSRFTQYATIHQNLKKIRRLVFRCAGNEKPSVKEFFKKAGEVRRQIQTAVSQLKSDGTNSTIAVSSPSPSIISPAY